MLGVLVELRQETWVGSRLQLLTQLLTHRWVAELTKGPHRVT